MDPRGPEKRGSWGVGGGGEGCVCVVYSGTCLMSTWVNAYSWIVSTPHSVPVYTSCKTNPDSKYF